MAKKTETIVTLTDDIDGSKADRTVAFAFDGTSYEIELSKKNAAALEKSLRPFIDAARKVRAGGRGRTVTAGSSRGKARKDVTDVRAWAKSNGLTVSERGRISQSVQDAYDNAH